MWEVMWLEFASLVKTLYKMLYIPCYNPSPNNNGHGQSIPPQVVFDILPLPSVLFPCRHEDNFIPVFCAAYRSCDYVET